MNLTFLLENNVPAPPPPPPPEPTYRDAAPPPTEQSRTSAFFYIEFSTTRPTYYNGVEARPFRDAKAYTLPEALRTIAGLRCASSPRIVKATTSLREVTQAECRDALLAEVEALVKKVVP